MVRFQYINNPMREAAIPEARKRKRSVTDLCPGWHAELVACPLPVRPEAARGREPARSFVEGELLSGHRLPPAGRRERESSASELGPAGLVVGEVADSVREP